MEDITIQVRNDSSILYMPPRAASIYENMIIALSVLWFVGFLYIITYVCRCRRQFFGEKIMPNALTAALYGVSDQPVAVRFSKDQGDRWVSICLFGMTVTALFNLTGVLLFGNSGFTDPAGGLFSFYSYFIIFAFLGAYFWPLFISHTLVHRNRGRLFGTLYSGLVLATVFLSSIYNNHSRLYALIMNLPYMICGSLVFLYFAGSFAFYKPPKTDSTTGPKVPRPVRVEEKDFDFEQSYVRRLLTPPNKAAALLIYETKLKEAQKIHDAEESLAEQKAEEGIYKVQGAIRRFFEPSLQWLSTQMEQFGDRLTYGYSGSYCRFSTRILAGLLMMLMMIYELTIFLCFQSFTIAEPYLGSDLSDEIETLVIYTTVAASGLAFTIIAFQALLTLRTYRIHMAQLRRGDYSFIPGGRPKLNYDLNDTVGFVGFQVGYGFIAFFYMFVMAELIMVLIWAMIYVPGFAKGIWDFLERQLFFLPVLSVMIFIQLQKYLVRWAYLSKKVGDETGSTDGRFYTPYFHSFTQYEYYMTFISIMRGFVSFIYSRFLTPLGFMILFGTRLDRCAVVQGWESMDEGYRSYIGMILADHHFNNPISLIFLLKLTKIIDDRKLQTQAKGINGSELEESRVFSFNEASVNNGNSLHNDEESQLLQAEQDLKLAEPFMVSALAQDASAVADSMTTPLLVKEDGEVSHSGKLVNWDGADAASRTPSLSSLRAQARWFLFITLSRNRQLIVHRKHRLVKAIDDDEL